MSTRRQKCFFWSDCAANRLTMADKLLADPSVSSPLAKSGFSDCVGCFHYRWASTKNQAPLLARLHANTLNVGFTSINVLCPATCSLSLLTNAPSTRIPRYSLYDAFGPLATDGRAPGSHQMSDTLFKQVNYTLGCLLDFIGLGLVEDPSSSLRTSSSNRVIEVCRRCRIAASKVCSCLVAHQSPQFQSIVPG